MHGEQIKAGYNKGKELASFLKKLTEVKTNFNISSLM